MKKEYICICGKHFNNSQAFNGHKSRCKIHMQNKYGFDYEIPNNLKNHKVWNKGLTKESDARIKKYSETFKQNVLAGKYTNFTGKASTLEKELLRRSNISNTMKNNPNAGGLRKNSGVGKKGYYKDIYCRSTYELVYVIYNIDHSIKFNPCKRVYKYEYNGNIHKYYPDFELEDGTIIEIKGYNTKQTEAKISAVKYRPIKVLYKNDLEYAFDYVKNNYEYEHLEDLYTK